VTGGGEKNVTGEFLIVVMYITEVKEGTGCADTGTKRCESEGMAAM
jgi:hypothetical protein